MNSINVNFENLTKSEREQLLKLVQKANASIRLADIAVGGLFAIGDIEFIKFAESNGETIAVTKESLFTSDFGNNNNFSTSKLFKRLNTEILPQIKNVVGADNVREFETNLLSLDGLDTYGKMSSKISLPTFDFYRQYVKIFDRYKLDQWWWLSTPDSTKEHYGDSLVDCVTPFGSLTCHYYNYHNGVRPVLHFVSSIFVSRKG